MILLSCLGLAVPLPAQIPTDIQQPGTQPGQAGSLERPERCDNCHGGYDTAVEPAHNWRGSMMAHAGRDPLFWASVAVVEQDFAGAGDLCLRCHAPAGWLEGRSTPTDGSGLAASDEHGVECDVCHRLVNPDDSEHMGDQFAPFLANDEGQPPIGYYGGGMYVFWGGADKLGPYSDAGARHQFLASRFHRESEFCGTCHDVSNPLVGDLAHNNGGQVPLPSGSYSGVPGAPVDGKAAFNNFPYAYGIVERTFSEHQSSELSSLTMSAYGSLPPEFQDGAIEEAWAAALASTPSGNYADGTPRSFSCQSCHMRPEQGYGCNKSGVPFRVDLPAHDLTGGNAWAPQAILWLDAAGRLRLGGGLTAGEVSGLQAGVERARHNLREAAVLAVTGNRLRIYNLTGHKLLTGYPEGRRAWLRVRWHGIGGALLREDGAYGDMVVLLNGSPLIVRSLLDPEGPRTRVYQAEHGITQEWAAELLTLGLPASMPLSYDRVSGAVVLTLGDVAAWPAGSAAPTFHFVLNNEVLRDNRIPPYLMSYDEATSRNILPVPETQYGAPGPGGHYLAWDELRLDPPAGAVRAYIELLYQPTSWEYVQFLYLANQGASPFLGGTGDDLLDAWLATGMAEPEVMATAEWRLLRAPAR
ncbi:MAG: hypothetical protein EYC70_13235 [Planctomycetota bacterium]|nr:MAG: hypothetical protein EYC70_13235 [Planctomycetota bacterium]